MVYEVIQDFEYPFKPCKLAIRVILYFKKPQNQSGKVKNILSIMKELKYFQEISDFLWYTILAIFKR